MEKNFSQHLDSNGAILVNGYFQLEGHPHIFAVGDVTALQEEKTAERALEHGDLVGEFIRKVLKYHSIIHEAYIPRLHPCKYFYRISYSNFAYSIASFENRTNDFV